MKKNLVTGALGVLLAMGAIGGGPAFAQTGSDAPVNAYFGTFGSAVSISVPAYHGLEPSLQLTYSSSANNGLAGVGWGLGGFGTIERANPGRGTPLYNGTDVFVLDGQELVPCAAGSTSPSCTTGGTHSTRIENYQRIKFDGAANTWTVWRKDGTRLVYGSTFTVATGTFRWGLVSATDTRNNQVSYGWWCGGADCYPDSVSYNGTTVRLYREARPDPITFPTGYGTLGRTLYRLKSIDVTVAGARSRTYRLLYGASASTGRSLLTNVQEFGRDAAVDAAGTVLSGSAHPARTYAYDHAASVTRSATWGYGHGNGDAGWSYADIDGDGKNEYVTHSNNGYHFATFFNRDGTLTSRTWAGGHGVGDSGWSYVDIDGDGKAEYVTHSGNGYHFATFFNKDGTISNRTWYGGHGNGDSGWSYADIDGDGKAEYVTHSGNGTHYATFFNKDGTLTNRTWTGGHGNGDSGWTYADINGDGRADYVTHSGNGTHYATFFNGASLDNRTWSGGHGVGDAGWSYVDINGDGRADYVTHSGNGAHYASFFSDTGVTSWTQWGHGIGDSGSTYVDIDGDGKAEYVTHSGNGTHYATWVSGGADLLVSAANGTGGTTTVQYTPSSAWPNTYLPIGAVLQTASAVTVTDGRGAASTVRYQYQGALWSSTERRFLGFRKVTAVVDAAGNYTETYYHQHVGCISKPEVTYYRDSAGNIYKYSTFGYAENAAPPYTSLMTDRWEYECNQGGSCRRTLLQIGYDQYGNGYLTYEYGDYDAAGDERTSLRGLYPNTGAYLVGLPAYENIYAGIGTGGALARQTLNEYDGAGTYAAAPTLGQVSRQRAWNNQTGGYSNRSFGYDAWGNVISETDPRGATTTSQYDATFHTHLVRRCDALGHCSSKTWEGGLDLVASETDLNGYVTAYTHDALHRPLQTTLPDGSAESFAYLDFGNPSLQRVRKTLWDGSGDGLWTDVYEDGLGRRYRSVKKGGLTQDTTYNDGSTRAWKQSAWYVAGETPQYQVFSFDGLGRLRTITNPDGTIGQRIYGNGYVVTYDELNHEKVTWTDAYGRTSQLREKNGAAYLYTTYQYDTIGNLVRLTDAAGNATTISWDSLGRKLAACDPDTGCSSYTYDDGGLMMSHRNARNQTTTFAYDAAGRPLTKTYWNGQQVRWTHDEPGHGASLGATTSVTDPSSSESRSYDFAGRLTSLTKCVSGLCYTTGRGYDRAGRPASITYPDGEQIAYSYDGAGRLAGVSGYVNGIAYNSRGQITSLTYANGTTTAFSYAASRQWLTAASVTGPGGTLYQASYGYDAGGRVASMSSSTNPLSNLGFGYDDLNRLTGVSGAQPQSLAYDALGNITYNSQVGNYGYGDAAHRHAATAAGTSAFAYDATGNMVSGNGRALEWDVENRLTKVTQNGSVTTFAYDSTGQRVVKSGPSGTTYTFGPLVEQGPSGLTKYYYAGPLLVAKRTNTTPVWFHQDHLGSVRLMTSATGAKVAGYDYAPFGGQVSASAQVANNRGYGGHATDETGLVYMNARYYDPQLGRFLSPDNIVPASENSQALNRYAYVYNNPISNTDPTGHLPVVAAIATAVSVGAAVGFTSTAFVIAAVGAATLTTGYILKDPVLTSIGSVLLGISSGYAFGAGFLAAKETVQAAWIGGTVSALTSPVSPLDANLKSAIGWAYTAQSLLFEFQHLNENIQKGADKLSEKIDLDNAKFQAAKAEKLSALPESDLKLLREPPEGWTAFQRKYGEAVETATRGAIKANEAIALNPTGGLVGPGGGFGTRVLDVLTGWIPGVRAHSVLHDLSGFLFNEFGRQGFTAGNGYLYLGLNWFGLSAGSPLSGQVEGLAVTGGNSIGSLFPRLF